MRIAAIDCGTNSIRLLIADKSEGKLVDVLRLMTIVRLGENIDKTGEFAEEALKRTFEACKHYARLCQEHGVEKIRFVATSATRDARNKELFLNGVKEILGCTPEVISGETEASLSFAGAISAVPATDDDNILVVDIGGGSTEFVYGSKTPEHAISVNMGCVRMTERFFTDGVSAQAVSDAETVVNQLIAEAENCVDFTKATKFIGLAGSVTTITAAHLGLDSYQPERINGTFMTFDEGIRACDKLLHSSATEREQMKFLHPKRADVIMGGALVLKQILRRLSQMHSAGKTQISGITTSEHDILDGIALSIN